MKELIEIQNKLKAPKNCFNKFGGYSYRNAEGILEAVKPLLKENDCQLTIADEIVNIGERYYVKATATIINSKGETESVTAFAREAESKKGMDESQVTGACSSYARKYCLNGLLLIDDNKDADTEEFHLNEAIGEREARVLKAIIEKKDVDVKKFLSYFKVKSVDEMTVSQYTEASKMLEKKPDREEKK